MLGLSAEEGRVLEDRGHAIKSLGEWFSDVVETLKDSPAKDLMGVTLETAKEWSGTAKFISKVIDLGTKEHSPHILGWLACSLAYREAAEEAIRLFGRPQSRLVFSADVIKERFRAGRLDDEELILGFTLRGAMGHPFTRLANQSLLLTLELGGYDIGERRNLIRRVRALFTEKLSGLLAGEHREKYLPFTQLLDLDTDDSRLDRALATHAESQRMDLESRPALLTEPFAIEQVYVPPECGVLHWGQVRNGHVRITRIIQRAELTGEAGVDLVGEDVDIFDERSAPRSDLLTVVYDLIQDSVHKDSIMIVGPPGAGKSTFTKKLSVQLYDDGFLPIRIPLVHFRVGEDIFDSVCEFLVQHGGPSGPVFKASTLREKVYSETVPTSSADISPYVFIFDGWDEINLSADEGFQKRVDRLLGSIRRAFFDQTRNTIRVLITGRPTQAISRADFLRDDSAILVMRPTNPESLKSFVSRLAQALDTRMFSGPSVQYWSLGNTARYSTILNNYSKEYPRITSLEVLGQPLLAHLAFKVLAAFEGDPTQLIERPTSLYRLLTDLTCKRAGKAPTESTNQGRTGHIEGEALRELLHGTALAITAFGTESIPEDELEARLTTLKIGNLELLQSAEQSLAILMISFFFKQATEFSGCEFLHKSFREYLTAEAIVETLKKYALMIDAVPSERSARDYWKDFTVDDARYELVRSLGEMFGGQWLSDEIAAHLSALLEWEISRASQDDSGVRRSDFGSGTATLAIVKWQDVRDTMADLWDWWGEGVHMRPQPTKKNRDWDVAGRPFVCELQQLAMRRVNYGKKQPPVALRTATIDAHLGYALFHITSLLHGLIADRQGWSQLAADIKGRELWSSVEKGPRRYQATVQYSNQSYILFAPSGGSRSYFKNYVLRINGAGVATSRSRNIEFPTGSFLRNLYLTNCDLRALNLDGSDMRGCGLKDANLERVSAVETDLRGCDLRGALFRDADLSRAKWFLM